MDRLRTAGETLSYLIDRELMLVYAAINETCKRLDKLEAKPEAEAGTTSQTVRLWLSHDQPTNGKVYLWNMEPENQERRTDKKYWNTEGKLGTSIALDARGFPGIPPGACRRVELTLRVIDDEGGE